MLGERPCDDVGPPDRMLRRQTEPKTAADQCERPIVSLAAERRPAFDPVLLQEGAEQVAKLASVAPDVLFARKTGNPARSTICQRMFSRYCDQQLFAEHWNLVAPCIHVRFGLGIDRGADPPRKELFLQIMSGAVDNFERDRLVPAARAREQGGDRARA